MVSSNGIRSESQLYLIRLGYFHLIRGPVCINLPLKVCHYLAPSLSTLTFLLPPLYTLFLKREIVPLSQKTSASLPPRLGLWLSFFFFFFPSLFRMSPQVQAQQVSHSQSLPWFPHLGGIRPSHCPRGFLPALLF